MIFSLQNVRAIAAAKVSLKPLTLVVGRNGGGKCSLLRWLPLLQQSRASGRAVVWHDRNGVDYGTYSETLRRGAEGPIGFGFSDPDQGISYDVELEWVEGATRVQRAVVRQGGVEFAAVRGHGAAFSLHADRRPLGSHLSSGDRGLFPIFNPAPKVHSQLRAASQAFQAAQSHLDLLLGRLTYVSPFRAEILRSERSPEPTGCLDARGKFLLNYLSGLSPAKRQELSDWTQSALGFGLKLHCKGIYTELRIIEAGGVETNICDVGSSIGQVLPVLVHLWNVSGVSGEGACPVVLEQPELLLHPTHQHRVGQLLARMVATPRPAQPLLLVETHSEHIINAVGLAIHNGTLAPDRVSVLVVEGGVVQEVAFDDRGHLLPPWPYGFFEGV